MTEHKLVAPYGSQRITYVTQGENVGGETVEADCGHEGGGHWHCVTHRESFANNMQRDGHDDDDRMHRLAWICHEHGPEVP